MTVTTEDNLTATTAGARPPVTADEVQGTARSEGDGALEPEPEVLVEEDLLVEDVSIDGMCGVY